MPPFPPKALCHTASGRFSEPGSTRALLPHPNAPSVFWPIFSNPDLWKTGDIRKQKRRTRGAVDGAGGYRMPLRRAAECPGAWGWRLCPGKGPSVIGPPTPTRARRWAPSPASQPALPDTLPRRPPSPLLVPPGFPPSLPPSPPPSTQYTFIEPY